jgi:hypothetical protein
MKSTEARNTKNRKIRTAPIFFVRFCWGFRKLGSARCALLIKCAQRAREERGGVAGTRGCDRIAPRNTPKDPIGGDALKLVATQRVAGPNVSRRDLNYRPPGSGCLEEGRDDASRDRESSRVTFERIATSLKRRPQDPADRVIPRRRRRALGDELNNPSTCMRFEAS